MAYVPKEWECGEVVTAEALNHIEQGILAADACCGESMLVLTQTGSREATAEECPNGGTVYTYNHTWQEVDDAVASGKIIAVKLSSLPGDLNISAVKKPSLPGDLNITIDFPLRISVISPGKYTDSYGVVIQAQDFYDLDADSADGYLYQINCNE